MFTRAEKDLVGKYMGCGILRPGNQGVVDQRLDLLTATYPTKESQIRDYMADIARFDTYIKKKRELGEFGEIRRYQAEGTDLIRQIGNTLDLAPYKNYYPASQGSYGR